MRQDAPPAAAPVATEGPASRGAEGDADAGVGIDVVRTHWGRLMEAVKQRSRPVYAFLLEAVPQSVEGTHLVLAVRHKFHLESLQEHKHRQIIEELLGSVMGARLRLGLVLGDVEPLASPVPQQVASAAPGRQDALVEEAVRRFGNPVQEIRNPE